MSPEQALASIKDALSEEMGVPADKVSPEANLRDDLELDSLDMAELLATLEDRTGQSIDEDAVGEVQTIGDVMVLVQSLAERATL